MSITSLTEQSSSLAGTGSMLNKQARPEFTSTRWQCHCSVKKSHSWTIWAKGVAWQHTGYTNNTCKALSWTKGGAFLCKMSLTPLVFKRYATTEDVNESSRWDSVPIRHNSTLGRSTITAIPVLLFSDHRHCALLLKAGPFLVSCSILTRLVPFYLCLLHVYIVSHIAQKKNNIKCIIFVVLEGLCVICLAPSREHDAPPSLLVAGLLSVTVALQMETFISARLIV